MNNNNIQFYYYGIIFLLVVLAPVVSLNLYFSTKQKNELNNQSFINPKLEIIPSYSSSSEKDPQTATPELVISNNSVNSFQQVTYRVTSPPSFYYHLDLHKIVQGIVTKATERGLPTEALSITLVDLKQSQCCAYASYQDEQPRYPASIVKLFWLIALFHQYEAGILASGAVSEKDLFEMIHNSDNEAASRVLDAITQTESIKEELELKKLNEWGIKRYWTNYFFIKSNFSNINISQKTFPIPYIDLYEPEGADYQIRFPDPTQTQPIRNYLTTKSVARLLFDIERDEAVSPAYIGQVKRLLRRDLNPTAWQDVPYNAIHMFLGEGLPPDTEFYSKMGWTFNNRNDAAIIKSPDGSHSYILVIFGDDKAFYEDKEFLPLISKFVYEQMSTVPPSELSRQN